MIIDGSLFVASGPDVARFEVSATMGVPPARVFAAFASAAGFAAAYAPDRPELVAHIDLCIGGRYEWLFDGKVGSNGCQVLSYVPDRMLSFTWNAPPTQAEQRDRRTWVVLELTPLGEHATALRLTHLGFGEGDGWAATRAYFETAWPHVLETMKTNLEGR